MNPLLAEKDQLDADSRKTEILPMTNEAREIKRKALSLPTAEREILANHLFQSIHNQELSDVDEAWLSLAEERWNTYRKNPEATIEKKAFFSQIRDSLGWKSENKIKG